MDKNWKKVAKENYKALEDIVPETATKDQYLLFAASVALIDHFENRTGTIAAESKAAKLSHMDYMAHVHDEYEAANQYYEYWAKTKDPKFKEMALQEVQHGDYFLKLAKDSNVISDDALQDAMTWRGAVLARLA